MKIIVFVIIFLFLCSCTAELPAPSDFNTKLVVYSILSNHYECQFVFVDTATHIDASMYKEFEEQEFIHSLPGIKDAEVIISNGGESKVLSPVTQKIAEFYRIYPKYLQGYYCDYEDKIDIRLGEEYELSVRYRDYELSAKTIIPEHIDIQEFNVAGSLNMSWNSSLNSYCYRIELFELSYDGYRSISVPSRTSVTNYTYNFTNSEKGQFKVAIEACDENFYEYTKNRTMNVTGGLGLFGSLYIITKEFEIK